MINEIVLCLINVLKWAASKTGFNLKCDAVRQVKDGSTTAW